MGRCVYCKKSSSFATEISVHKFPKDKNQRQQWIQNMGWSNWTPTESSALCCDHFEENCIDKRDQKFRLRKGSVPTVFNNNKKNSSNLQSSCQMQPEEVIKLDDVSVPTKKRETEEVLVWRPSLIDQLRASSHDHTYALTMDVALRQADAVKKKLRKISVENRTLMKKQKRSNIYINKLTNAVVDLQKLQQHPKGFKFQPLLWS